MDPARKLDIRSTSRHRCTSRPACILIVDSPIAVGVWFETDRDAVFKFAAGDVLIDRFREGFVDRGFLLFKTI